jgi:malonate transporter and related proteins
MAAHRAMTISMKADDLPMSSRPRVDRARRTETKAFHMLTQSLTIVAPIFFVLLLGYAAGRAKEFDSEQVAGINELVLDFALPASLFVGTVSTPRDQLLQQGPLLLAMLIAMVGLYVIVFLLGRHLFQHASGVAALQAITVSFGAGPYFGPAVLSPTYGVSSDVAISMMALILNVIIVPMTLILVDMSGKTAVPGGNVSIGSFVGAALVNAIRKPFVWAPLLAAALVLIGVRTPHLFDSMLSLIGHATGGVALFAAGLTIAARNVVLNLEVGVNTVFKMLVQPVAFFLLVLTLSIKPPYIYEGLLLMALPAGPMGILLATRYKMYVSEASSTVALTVIAMLITLPAALFLIGSG